MTSTFARSSPATLAPAPAASDAPETRPAPPPADPAEAPEPPRRVRLGEELPLFCERCGYALHGLPQSRCDRCQILHFACPECGHHQPINTLRPAAQRILARLRLAGVVLWVLFKLNFFGWLLVGWFAMGVEWSYTHYGYYVTTATTGGGTGQAFTYRIGPRAVDGEAAVAFTLFAVGFGLVGRLLLLRWRRGWAVGLVLAALVLLAVEVGALAWWGHFYARSDAIPPLGRDFHALAAATALVVLLGAAVAWPLWRAVAHLLLPAATARTLLDWHRAGPEARLQA